MSTLKEFEVSAKQVDNDSGTPFRLPDYLPEDSKREQTYTDLVAYQPDDAQFAVLLATTGRGANDAERIAGFINFFVAIMDEEGADYITARLLNRKDPFGIQNTEDILEWLTGEWTGNPTQGPSGSTPSPSNVGPKSTESSRLLI